MSLRVLLINLLLLLPAWAAAQAPSNAREEARRHLERGVRLYDVQSYLEAIAEFKAGYQLDPDPQFLFALGQAQRLIGDCKNAIEAFRAYLRTGPAPHRAQPAMRLIAQCEEELAKAPPPAPSEPAVPAALVEPPPPPPRPAARPRVATWVGVGLSAATLVAAAAVEGAAAARYDELRSGCAPPAGRGCSDEQIDGLRLQINTATGLFVTAGVLTLGTIVAAILEHRARRPARALAIRF